MNLIKKIVIISMLIISSLSWAKKNNFENKKHLSNRYIYIKNNVFLIKINKFNGNIYKNILLNYTDNDNNKKLISQINIDIYKKKNNNIKKKIIFKKHKIYVNNKYIKILLEKKNNDIKYIKKFLIKKNSYNFYLYIIIKNKSNKIIFHKIYTKLINKENIKNNFNNISFFNDKNIFTKYFIDNAKNTKILKNNLNWIAISEKYFSTILITPKISKNNNLYIKKKDKNNVSIKYINNFKIEPEKKKIIKFKLWTGPKLINYLNKIEKNLDINIIDFGKLWFISIPVLKLINLINKIVNNWGYSIIITTIIFKIITYPLNKLQLSMLTKINEIQPKIKKIKKKYKNNKKKINKKIIKIYKKYNINPISGSIATIIQIPIFLSIYNVIKYSAEFKDSKFIFWIKDLSSYDKYYLLPLIMGTSILLSQKKNKNDKYINTFFIPIMFTILSLYFPSGVLLYYITNNLITLIQQKYF